MLAIAEVVRVLLFTEMKRKPKELAMVPARLVGGIMLLVVMFLLSGVSGGV